MVFEGNVIVDSHGKAPKKLDKKNLEAETTPNNLPYLLICTIDSSESTDLTKNEEYKKNIGWSTLVSSTDTLGFCQNTSKEDKKRQIIASWEEKENDRANLAKISRQKFLIEQKLLQGQQINDDEKNILESKRERKAFMKPKG